MLYTAMPLEIPNVLDDTIYSLGGEFFGSPETEGGRMNYHLNDQRLAYVYKTKTRYSHTFKIRRKHETFKDYILLDVALSNSV